MHAYSRYIHKLTFLKRIPKYACIHTYMHACIYIYIFKKNYVQYTLEM